MKSKDKWERGVVPQNILVPILRDDNMVCQNYMKNEKKMLQTQLAACFFSFLIKLSQFTRLCEKKKKMKPGLKRKERNN